MNGHCNRLAHDRQDQPDSSEVRAVIVGGGQPEGSAVTLLLRHNRNDLTR